MLLVRAVVRPSRIHGDGLFCLDPLPKGTPLWRFEPEFDQVLSPARWARLPEVARSYLRHFSYCQLEDRHLVLSGDHTRFMNHADHPNTGALPGSMPPVTTVALRDIPAGEELTCNYWHFDADAPWKFGLVPADAPLGAPVAK
ncbi:MAG TPA: SET domain-containing protein [Candidatus Limnocylindria bacterium]|jgi:SET domain-containing protein|nr:SET domain-containing protein [Candidatus Limnocylindria bacterium]